MHSDRLFIEDPEAAEAAREVRAWIAGTRAASETAKALITCDRMLSLHPNDRLFEGLRLEVESKDREIRLEFIRRLASELEKVPDFDARIESIRQALHRYPSEPYLIDLLENATARRDLFNTVVAEARNQEHIDAYAQALKQWHLVRELFPMMPGLDNEIRRVETLAETQRRTKRRAEFVDSIFQLSSTGAYSRALYQCINALAEFPNDGGLLTIKNNLEEKSEHATELQNFVADGLTFLRAHEVDAALECFGKAKSLDQSNLQVRYLVGIALLEKARLVMHDDRRKLRLLLDEARSFIPDQPELQTLSFESDGTSDETWEKSLVRVELPDTELHRHCERPATVATTGETPQPPGPYSGSPAEPIAQPIPARQNGSFQTVALLGLVILGVLAVGWVIYVNQSTGEKPSAVPPAQRVDIKAQAEITEGDLSSEPKTLQINLQPILMDVYVTADQPAGVVEIDGQPRGDLTNSGITISGVEPGVHSIKIQTPDVEVEFSFEFHPGQIPTPVSLPARQIASVLFAGSADGKARVHCNCAPAGLRVGDFAEMIRAGGLELPLEGQRSAELWMGKRRTNLTIQGSHSPVATIALFSSPGTPSTRVEPGR